MWNRWWVWVLVLGLLLCPLLPVLMMAMMLGSASQAVSTACQPAISSKPATYTGKGVGSLTPLQMTRAAAVVAQGRSMGISDRGIVVALATASQESGFKVYANDGVIQYDSDGDPDLAPEQRAIGKSLTLPHDAVGTDHGSLGVFQQQWPWWGTMAELMDPAASAKKFFEALRRVKGWESLPVTVAAQTVQRSAYPDAYADDQALAEQLLATIGPTAGDQGTQPVAGELGAGDGGVVAGATQVNGVYVGGTADCLTASSTNTRTGAIVFPLPKDSGYVNQHNFGRTGGRWSSTHTGNDYSVAAGTPVFAIHDGTVEYDDSQSSWAGSNFVRITTGPGKLATWYAHMSSRTVQAGQKVTAGQKIGTVGSEGNSSGPHLHLEVHPTGGSIYEDPVDPVAWLAKNMRAGTRTDPGRAQTVAKLPATPRSGTLRIGSFNALGHSHTNGPRANARSFPSSHTRARRMVPFLERHQLDLIGFQELQPPQAGIFRRMAGRRWASRINVDNGVAWARDKFTLVNTRSLAIPYFRGATRHMPVVRLRERSTGRVFTVISIHNPANAHGPAGHWRTAAEKIERRFARAEQAAGRPVLLLGDFNARETTYCTVTAGGAMTASTGGTPPTRTSRCNPPPHPIEIDWIFGTRGITFTGHAVDKGSRRQRISDHFLISADFQFGGHTPTTTGDLSVLSLDVNHGTGGATRISKTIANAGADVVALQSIDGNGTLGSLAQQVADELGMQYAFTVVGRRRGREVADNAVLSRYPIVAADHDPLPALGGPPRGLLRVTVAVGKVRVEVYATHLTQAGKARLGQAQAVADEIARPGCPTVVLGKLNLSPKHLASLGVLAPGRLVDAQAGQGSPGGRSSYVLHDPTTRPVDVRVLPPAVTGTRPVHAVLRLDKEESCS